MLTTSNRQIIYYFPHFQLHYKFLISNYLQLFQSKETLPVYKVNAYSIREYIEGIFIAVKKSVNHTRFYHFLKKWPKHFTAQNLQN